MRRCGWLTLAFLISCGGEPEERVESRPAAELGAQLFSDPALSGSTTNSFSCATCHASTSPAEDRILPGYPLAGATERPTFWGGQIDNLLEATNACSYYFMGSTKAWTGQEQEAQALYAYLVSLPAEAPQAQPFSLVLAVQDLPAGDATRGQDVYRRACAYCHGTTGDGQGKLDSTIPTLPDESVAAFRDTYKFTLDQTRLAFIEKVRHGAFLGLYGRMPPYSLEVLSDEDLGSLLAYLRLYP